MSYVPRRIFYVIHWSKMRFLLIVLSLPLFAIAQTYTPAIEDNSYYIEEAYNQEDRVVQHILNGSALSPGDLYDASFTQEWPAFGHAHQLSYTIPFQHNTLFNPTKSGIGDIMVHYRYQLMNEPELAIAPRISIILPTGDHKFGFGNGVTGAQVNLPISKRISNELITHSNIGATIFPNVTISGSNVTFSDYFLGGSVIYLADPKFNMMAELLYTNTEWGGGRSEELIFSPGFRYAIDLNDLQIVPGIAFPFSFTSGKTESGVLLYFSFEHLF